MKQLRKSFRARSASTVSRRGRTVEPLEHRLMMAAQPVITEFLAKNTRTLIDGNGNYSDWVEVSNTGDATADLAGWHLSDDATRPDEWTFPAGTTLAAGASIVVFADSTGTVDPAGNLHANFSLGTDGEVLSLARPDNAVVSQFSANGTPYPAQQADVSYGTGTVYRDTTLVAPGAAAKAFVPTNSALDASQWAALGYNDGTWTAGTTGVGYDTGAYEDNTPAPVLSGDWSADALVGSVANGAKVSTWTDSVHSATAVATGAPRLVTSAYNGHAAVRFNPADGNDNLRVPAAANPMAGADDFTVAVVFKATAGLNSRNQWYNNAGLVDAYQSGAVNDWGTSVSSSGYVGAGLGGPASTIYGGGGTIVSGGRAHVAVFTRTGTTYTLYVDGGDGVTGTCGASDRNVYDMVFGSLAGNANYFTGDLAEVRTYDGYLSSAAKAYTLAQPLGTKYALTLTTPTAVTAPTLTGDWTGDSLASLGNNAAVSTWASTANSTTRNATPTNTANKPTVLTNQLNGHAVVHFAGTGNLRVAAASNPMAGAGNFTVAVVFRTATAGVGTSDDWYNNTGLVDAEQGGITNDWGLAINSSGQAAAGIGNPDESVYSGGLLADGNAHVLVYTKAGGVTRLYVDGSPHPFEGTGGAAARNSADMVFGSIATNINYLTGDLAEVQVYNGALAGDAADALAGTLSTKYGVVAAPSPYAPLIGLNLQSAMSGVATTAAVRVPFTVPADASLYTRLLLDVKYDDGFVAYLNGTEVARRNAPAGTITYQSTSTDVRPQTDALAYETIDLTAYRSLLRGGGQSNVLAFRSLNTSKADPDLLLVPRLTASTSTVGPAYFTTPTPGAANTTPGYAGFVAPVTISVPHGNYTSAFTTTLSTATAGATIYYTTDGSDPAPGNGTAVASGTAVTITTTTGLRAAAYLDTYLPSAIATSTYVFVADVLRQANTAPAGAYWDTAMDPRIVNLSQTYTVAQALAAIPTVSLNLPFEDIFGATGIYKNATQKGRQWERETSVEYFDPTNPALAGFQVDAGLRIQGGNVRYNGSPKQAFRLFFRSDYGTSQLNYPLFGTANPQQSFDHVLLKSIHNYGWANSGGTTPNQGDLVRDSFARDLQLAVTGHAATGKWVQLYIDGQYWGLYDLTEEPDETWAAANFGGSKDDYDVIQPDGQGTYEVVAGDGSAYANLFATLATDLSDGSVSPAEYAQIKQLVDVKTLADYMLQIFYRGDQDAPVLIGNATSPRNFYAFRDAKTNAPYQFTTWDGELGLSDVNFNRTTITGNLNPATLFQGLKTNVDFAQLVGDEAYRLFYNNGPLQASGTVDNPKKLFDADAAQINVAIVGESARWGDAQNPTAAPLTRDGNWVGVINALDTNYFPNRSGVVLSQLKAISQFALLGTLPPTYQVNGTASRGGSVPINTPLTLVDPNATTAGDVLYYTLDGSDPRLAGGGISPAAKVYAGAFPLAASGGVTVRTLNGSTWSPVDAVTFSVNVPAAAGNVAVTEVNYHPADPTAAELAVNSAWTDADFEFVELQNTTANAVDLAGAAFTAGVTLTFGSVTVPAGGRVVVVSNPAAFAARYGPAISPVGTYTGHLSNSSATVTLKSAAAATIASFTYQDSWYPRTDGDGSSLEAIGTTVDSTAATWRASYEVGGTPTTAGSPVTDVVVNEVLSAATNAGPDQVELYNATNAPINIGGWFLSDSAKSLAAYTIPAGTVIAAHGYLVVSGADFDNLSSPTAFGLNGTVGDQLYLTKPKTTGATTAYAFADNVAFGTSALGETFGRSPDGVGLLYPQATATLGSANGGYRLGPVDITELMYTPAGGNADLTYVELQNQTNATLDVSGWTFATGITYTFPAGTTLAPHEAVTVVRFDPTGSTSLAATALANFRSAYGTTAGHRLLGPFTGSLAGKGEDVELARPDAPRADAPTYTPLLLVDDVTYSSTGPWPTTAAGQSLVRLSNKTIGQTAANWAAAAGSPDAISYGNAYYTANSRVTIPSGTVLDSLTLAGTATATLAAGTGSYARLGGLSLAAAASFDLGTGALIFDGVAPAAVSALIATAFAGGAWTGPGLTSSAAVADSGRLTAVGLLANTAGIYTTFDGQPVSTTSVLVRHTYYGDANLDGRVDVADYTRIDAGFLIGGTGWLDGDYNRDGRVDASDYTLMDNAFNHQSTPLFPANQAAPAAVVAKAVVPTSVPTSAPPVRHAGVAVAPWWSTVNVARSTAAAWPVATDAVDRAGRKAKLAAPVV